MADSKLSQKILTQLQRFSKIGFKNSNSVNPTDKIFSLKQVVDQKGYKTFEKEKFPDEIKRLFNFWLMDCHSTREDWRDRTQLFQDCDMIALNMAMISKAMEVMSDEVVQADTNMQPIFIEAKPKVKTFILDFFDKIGLYNLIRPTVLDIIKYGNAAWLLEFDDSGVSGIIPIDCYSLKDRLEFTPEEVDRRIKGDDNLFSQFKSHDRINSLIASITNKENISSYFKSYLFGFQVGDKIVPPWRLIHFRNFTTNSPIKPFGVPVFIHSIAPYRQWDAAMTMQIVARGARFPKEVYKLHITNAVDPSSKLQLANEFLNELLNSGIGTSKKELPGIGEIRISIDDLFTWDQEVPNIDLGKIDDIEMLLSEVANSTFLPRNLIDPSDTGFGDSGVSLVEKFKPFARLVFRIQNIFLANLSQLIKIHMIHSNKFSSDEMEFVLSMPYPESQVNQDIIASQTSQWGLANDVITSLSDKLLGGESLPSEVVRQIYQKLLPYDDETIDNFIDGTLKARKQNDVIDYEDEVEQNQLEKDIDIVNQKRQNIVAPTEGMTLAPTGQNIDPEEDVKENPKKKNDYEEQFKKWKLQENINALKRWRMLEKTMGKTYLQEKINDEVFSAKQNNFREGVFRGSHFYSSRNIYTDFPAEQLREFDKQRLQRLKEDNNENKDEFNKNYYKEEVKYDFVAEKEKAAKEKLEENDGSEE